MIKLGTTTILTAIFALSGGYITSDVQAQSMSADSTAGKSISMDIPDTYRIGGFLVGPQTYTFNRLTIYESIQNAARMGGHIIEFYPGQMLSPDHGDVRFGHNMDDKYIAMVKEWLEEFDIIPVNYGVVGLPNNEEAVRDVFEFASELGLLAVTSEPSMEAMDLIEQMVIEYDIMLAIHNHPRRSGNPDYRVWDPAYVLSMVEDRDYRLGASADIGHWIRSGIAPVDGLQILEGRVVSLHMTDVDQFGPEGRDVIMGTGVGDLAAVLDELKRQNFGGHLSIEYEANWNDNVPDVSQNVGYVRGWAQARGY